MKIVALYISLAAIVLSVGCSNESEGSSSSTVSIASLRNVETNYRSVLISDNIVVEGQITANSKYGEFYNCLTVEDGSAAAVKIMCEVDDDYLSYPFGSPVTIYCNGLYLINHYGPIILGAEPTDDYTLDYISQSELGQHLKVDNSSAQPLEPETRAIGELSPLDSYRYLKFYDVSLSNDEGTTTFCARDTTTGRTVATIHTITDPEGLTLPLNVSLSCSYADRELPTEPCNLGVIVEYYNGEYEATITNMDIR